MHYTESHLKLYRIWEYLLTYKVDDELPEELWDAEEIIKQAIHEHVMDELKRQGLR